MREQMSAFDIRAVLKELAFLDGSFIDNIYQTAPDELILKFKVPRDNAAEYGPFRDMMEEGTSRYVTAEIRCRAGRYIHLLSRAVEKPQAPSTFAVRFRRQLANAFVGRPDQPGLERIVILPLSKATEFTLVMEMFGDGNIVLVEEGKIVLPMRSQQWRGRKLSAGEPYLPPPVPADPFSLDRAGLTELMAGSGRDVVRCLAVEANLSGAYAEEVLRRAKVDKARPAAELDEDEAGRIADSFAEVLDDITGSVGGDGLQDDEGGLTEVRPAGVFRTADGEPPLTFPTFNLAVEALADTGSAAEVAALPGARVSRVAETRRMVEQQEGAVEKYKADAVELKAKGDAVYEHYQRCQDVLTSVTEAKERLGWDEVVRRLAESGEGVVADPSTGRVRFDVEAGGRPVTLVLDIRLDINGNANRLYEAAKKARRRSQGAAKALVKSRAKLAKLEAAEAAQTPGVGPAGTGVPAPPGGAGQVSAAGGASSPGEAGGEGADPDGEPDPDALHPPPKKRQRRRFWFEDFRWFITSSGHVAAGGKDAGSNDKVVKRHLQDLDRYAHADVHGASSVVVKSMDGAAPPEEAMEEACGFAALHSRAWEGGHGGSAAYWVLPEQVSKTPQAGEAMPRGAFIIRGKRNWFRDLSMVAAFTEVEHEGIRLLMGAPLVTVERMSRAGGVKRRFVALAPGPMDKNTAAQILASAFRVTVDEALSVLPSGGVQLVDAPGMPGALVDAFKT